jgi:hypothetical protein
MVVVAGAEMQPGPTHNAKSVMVNALHRASRPAAPARNKLNMGILRD